MKKIGMDSIFVSFFSVCRVEWRKIPKANERIIHEIKIPMSEILAIFPLQALLATWRK